MNLRITSAVTILLLPTLLLSCSKTLAKELLTFDQLPALVVTHVKEVRQSCKKMNDSDIANVEMQGIHTFYLTGERRMAILIDNRNLCSGSYKGANCHTYGCDVLVFVNVSRDQWTKIFDEPVVGQMFLSTSVKSEFLLAAMSITGKYSKLCGSSVKSSYCDYLLFWKQGRWVWQKLR